MRFSYNKLAMMKRLLLLLALFFSLEAPRTVQACPA